SVRCVVVTGAERAFAAGGDVDELAKSSVVDALLSRRNEQWTRIRRIHKPVIAAVSGWCLGGGNELAMSFDVVIAAESARFGQPEIKLGLMPGAGGTQWLTRISGKSAAMMLLLTGEDIDAREALRLGLVARVVPDSDLIEETTKLAARIAKQPPLAARL